ncbi:MAG TPA: protein kinase [Polyangiales bacterium]|nr:protein kinase [Polyangiales bacterium]
MATRHSTVETARTLMRSEPSSRGSDPGPPPVIDGYEIESLLGQGGMGVVYSGIQTALGRRVAIKMVLSDQAPLEDRERFAIEAEAVARLQHPNIVQIYEIGAVLGRPFFTLEYVDGGTLEQHAGGKPMPWREAVQLVATLARAVHVAHRQGIVHRDLKPGNVLLAQDGTPKITDFGIAKRMGAAKQTQTGKILGTPSYMSPEQALGGKQVGPATDIYALGAILYDLLTGRPPFEGDSTLDTMVQTIQKEPVSPRALQPKLPRDLEVVTLRCLEKSPDRRYDTALALADDLERMLRNEPVHARPISFAERSWRWARRNPAAASFLSVSALALMALIATGAWFTSALQRELLATEQARQEATDARNDLRIRLIRSTAENIDADLRQLASVPRVVADALQERSDWTEAQLEHWLRAQLERQPHIFGMAIAFEPRTFRDDVEDFSLYVYRGANGIIAKQLLPPAYTPIYREWPWYRDARGGASSWSEPYVDTGGGGIPMATFSTPFMRDGKWAGVVTADLSLDYFVALDRSLRNSRTHRGAYAFVTTASGTLLSHPDPSLRFPATNSIGRLSGDIAGPGVAARIRNGETGHAHGRDVASGKPTSLIFAPIASTGWSCVGVAND